jgi:outer membrane usher protein
VTGYVEASKTLSHEAGSWGWRARDHEGSDARRSASLAHRMQSARVEAGVHQDRDGVRATGQIEGAVAVLGGDVFTSNRIDDAFAVVDVHAPGIKVQKENNTVGVTNDDGRILIPNLNAYHKNKISIDPLDLPLDAEAESTVNYVAPGFRSGVYVDFDVKKSRPGAIVILKDASGKFLPAGSEAHLDGSEEIFVVGYEGQTFVQGLSAVNTLIVNNGGATCAARFSFMADGSLQPTIGPEICQ